MRFCAFVCAFFLTVLPATAFDTIAHTAMVVDQKTGTVLLEKNADQPIPPASMSKLMTLNMLFEALQDGRVFLDSMFTVSDRAAAKGGSKMFVREGAAVSVENLIRGITVQSGNDACIVVAEHMAGSEADFARIMTARAQKLGMTSSTFTNATGWPHPNHRMSARDLVFLANRLITRFPEYYGYFAEQTFTWEGITQKNRNPILGRVQGADGLKTGHTQEAGYSLVASASQGDRRVVLMIAGLESAEARASEATRLMNWAFRQFKEVALIGPGTTVARGEVWLGREKTVPLVVKDSVSVLIPHYARDEVTLNVSYIGPIAAPIIEGTEAGRLHVIIPGLPDQSFPVYAGASVDEGGLLQKIRVSAGKIAELLN
ncbi:MAG: D-alanyl-D-alanine carboxypeptidase [Rhodobacteraceae bacterium]|nr:D-alanyl-D-alanine carboxypeptidase [Paracoccaceae bacterium]